MGIGQREGTGCAFFSGADDDMVAVGILAPDDLGHDAFRHGVNGRARLTAPVDALVYVKVSLIRVPSFRTAPGILEQAGDGKNGSVGEGQLQVAGLQVVRHVNPSLCAWGARMRPAMNVGGSVQPCVTPCHTRNVSTSSARRQPRVHHLAAPTLDGAAYEGYHAVMVWGRRMKQPCHQQGCSRRVTGSTA